MHRLSDVRYRTRRLLMSETSNIRTPGAATLEQLVADADQGGRTVGRLTMHKPLVQAPLPVREGVAPSRVFLPPGPWATVLEFLEARYHHLPEGLLRARMTRGDIVDSTGRPQAVDEPYRPRQWLWYYREVDDEPILPDALPVLFRDALLVVVDKPHFLATAPAGRHVRDTVLTRLRRDLDLPRLTPVHRLDRETAGVLVFCADPARRGAYQTLFQRREVARVYEAVAPWTDRLRFPLTHKSRLVNGREFLMQEEAGTPNSETYIERVRKTAAGQALYRLYPVSGRKHQLRVHLAALGMPILDDELYPVLLPQRAADNFQQPLQLLARSIAFTDPVTGQVRAFSSQRRLQQDI